MRIAFVHAEALTPLSGANLRGHEILRALVERGHQIDLVAPATAGEPIPSVNHFATSSIDRFSKVKTAQHARFVAESLALSRKMSGPYDLIYAHRLGSGPLGRRLARRWNAPLLVDLWEVDFLEIYPFQNPVVRAVAGLLGRVYEGRLLRNAEGAIVLTEAMRSYVREFFGVDALVSYDAADSGLFEHRTGPGTESEGRFRIVFHGGIDRRDGIVQFLDAFETIVSEIDAELLLIGRGAAMPDVLRRIQAAPWRDRVEVRGWVPYPEIPKALMGAGCAVIPSIDSAMNRLVIPRKTFEYLSLGIPMVVSDLPAMREVLTEESATFVTPGDVAGFARSVVALARDREKRLEQSRALLEKSRGLTLRGEVARIIDLVEATAGAARSTGIDC